MFHIQEITYPDNCVFHYVHKEINNTFSLGVNYLFRESGLQITLRLLSSSLGNTDSSFAYIISRISMTNVLHKEYFLFYSKLKNIYLALKHDFPRLLNL